MGTGEIRGSGSARVNVIRKTAEQTSSIRGRVKTRRNLAKSRLAPTSVAGGEKFKCSWDFFKLMIG